MCIPQNQQHNSMMSMAHDPWITAHMHARGADANQSRESMRAINTLELLHVEHGAAVCANDFVRLQYLEHMESWRAQYALGFV